MGKTGYITAAGLVVVIFALVGVGIWVKSDMDAAMTRLERDLQASEKGAAELEEALDEADVQRGNLESRVTELELDLSETSEELMAVELELADASEAVVDVVTQALATQGIDEVDASCIAEVMAEARGVAGLLSGLADAAADPTGSDSILGMGADMLTAMESCGLAAGDLFPNTFGDNPELDAMYEACESGSASACDALYFASPVGSEYERFGQTCGDRFTLAEAPALCEGEI